MTPSNDSGLALHSALSVRVVSLVGCVQGGSAQYGGKCQRRKIYEVTFLHDVTDIRTNSGGFHAEKGLAHVPSGFQASKSTI
jgi:hypothetical protein